MKRLGTTAVALVIAVVLALAFTYLSDRVWPPTEGDCNAVAGHVR